MNLSILLQLTSSCNTYIIIYRYTQRIKSFKNKWEKIKRNVKLRLSEEKKEIYKTGGGFVKTFEKIEFYEDIEDLLGISAIGLDSCFDFDIVGICKSSYEFKITT